MDTRTWQVGERAAIRVPTTHFRRTFEVRHVLVAAVNGDYVEVVDDQDNLRTYHVNALHPVA